MRGMGSRLADYGRPMGAWAARRVDRHRPKAKGRLFKVELGHATCQKCHIIRGILQHSVQIRGGWNARGKYMLIHVDFAGELKRQRLRKYVSAMDKQPITS